MSKQFTDSDKAEMHRLFEKFKKRAAKLLNNRYKIEETLRQGLQKAIDNEHAISEVINDLRLLISLVKDYISGTYKEIPYGSIVAAVGGILYFVSPVDFIPDFIPFIGYVDDLFVISLVLRQIHTDLEKYHAWKRRQSRGKIDIYL